VKTVELSQNDVRILIFGLSMTLNVLLNDKGSMHLYSFQARSFNLLIDRAARSV